ncbi:MAG: Crp/Fnr family transcriptional regulator [Cellvibrionaceae bacterium]|nr:Crp/Fnr family transcriptional regulator [Cellvibrionaceae bacterium]
MNSLPHPQQNQLIASLSAETQRRLLPHLEPVHLEFGKVLCGSGDVLTHAYFPANAIASLVYVTRDGASSGLAVVGNEGIVGVTLFMGGDSSPLRAIVLKSGYAYRMKACRFKEEINQHGDLNRLMLRYSQSLITQTAQTAVCNRHHSIEQRLCRWLLQTLDRLETNQVSLTQEFIAEMLGVRREGVTEAAGKLQRMGVIEYSRGRITVLDRDEMEYLACECYSVVKSETDRLLPCAPLHHQPHRHQPHHSFRYVRSA